MAKPQYGYCFRPDLRRDDCSGTLSLWIEHYGDTRFVPTTYDVRYKEWNAVAGTLKAPSGSTGRARRLAEYNRAMARNLRLVEKIIEELSQSTKRFTADDVANAFNRDVAEGIIPARPDSPFDEVYTEVELRRADVKG